MEGGGGDSSLPWHRHPDKIGEEMGRRRNDKNAASPATRPPVTTFQLSDASLFLIWSNFRENNGFPSLLEQGNITAYENGSEYLQNYTPEVGVNQSIRGGGGGLGSQRSGPNNGRNKWACRSEGRTEESEGITEAREIDLLMYSSSEEGEDWEEGEEDELMSTGHYSPEDEAGVDEAMDFFGRNDDGWMQGRTLC